MIWRFACWHTERLLHIQGKVMNLSNAFGKFGALIVEVITNVRASLVNVSDDFAEWLGTESGKSTLQSAVSVAVKSVTEAYEKFKTQNTVIDFDSTPTIPADLMIAPDYLQISSRVRGNKKFIEITVRVHLDDGQRIGSWLMGYNLMNMLAGQGQVVYGAQLSDFYLEHPELFPEGLKDRGWIFFWGTIYLGEGGRLYVRCLSWNGTMCVSAYRPLIEGWCGNDPAAVSANQK